MKGVIVIEGHVQGLSNTRSLGEYGVPVYVIDKTDCIARHSKFCKAFFICPDFESSQFAAFLLDLGRKQNLEGWLLMPSNDHAVYSIARNRDRLTKVFSVITPNLEVVTKIYDKVELLGVAAQCGVPIPKTYCYLSNKEPVNHDLSFPVITKGRNGLSFYKAMKRKALLAQTPQELELQLGTIAQIYDVDKTFTQELIPFNGHNKTVSFTAFCVDGEIKTYWMGVKLREHPIQFGTATFTQSVFIQECLNSSVKLLKELEYNGICEAEYLLDPRTNEYKLIEINARTWLWVGHARACGIDYARIAYDYVNGKAINYPQSYPLDVYWYNPFTDFVYSIIAIIKRKLSVKDYFSSLLKPKINSIYSRGDKKPCFAYFLKMIFFMKRR